MGGEAHNCETCRHIEAVAEQEEECNCETCRHDEVVGQRTWDGGLRNGLFSALCYLDEIQAAIAVGQSKVQVLRTLIRKWGDVEPSPHFLPLMIMTPQEMMDLTCPTCEAGTRYSRTEDKVDSLVKTRFEEAPAI